MGRIEKLEKIMRQAAQVVAFVGMICLIGLAMATIADVLMRWLMNSPIEGVFDLHKLVIAVVIATFFPMALMERHHISITFLGDAVGPRANKLLNLFADLALLGFLVVMSWQLIAYVFELIDTGETTWILQWSIAPWWGVAAALITFCIPVQAFVTIRDAIAPPPQTPERENLSTPDEFG